MTSKEIATVFQSYFPNIVVEKWFPGGFKHVSTDHIGYLFTYHKKHDWILRSYHWPEEPSA